MPSSHLILGRPLLLLPPIPSSIRVFSNESTLRMRWPKYWSFSFSIILSKEISGLISFRMDWLDLLAVQGTLKSLLQHHSSNADSVMGWFSTRDWRQKTMELGEPLLLRLVPPTFYPCSVCVCVWVCRISVTSQQSGHKILCLTYLWNEKFNASHQGDRLLVSVSESLSTTWNRSFRANNSGAVKRKA